MKLSRVHNNNLNTLYRELTNIKTPKNFNQGNFCYCLFGQAVRLGILGLHVNDCGLPRLRNSGISDTRLIIVELFGKHAAECLLGTQVSGGIAYNATWKSALSQLREYIVEHGFLASQSPCRPVSAEDISRTSIQSMKVLVDLAAAIEELAHKAGVANVKIENIGQTSFKLNISL